MKMARHRSRSRPARWRGSVAFSGVDFQRGETLDARGHRQERGTKSRAPMLFSSPCFRESRVSRDAFSRCGVVFLIVGLTRGASRCRVADCGAL